MKKGRSLEKLVALIEEKLAASEGVKNESPGYLPDRVTGKRREHDVLITVEHAHHQVRIAIECRDRAKPVGVPQVEAFLIKCQDTGVNQGIIASPSGFYRTAIEKAHHDGIRCFTLEHAEDFTWLFAPAVAVVTVELRHAHLTEVQRLTK